VSLTDSPCSGFPPGSISALVPRLRTVSTRPASSLMTTVHTLIVSGTSVPICSGETAHPAVLVVRTPVLDVGDPLIDFLGDRAWLAVVDGDLERSEEHTSELQ